LKAAGSTDMKIKRPWITGLRRPLKPPTSNLQARPPKLKFLNLCANRIVKTSHSQSSSPAPKIHIPQPMREPQTLLFKTILFTPSTPRLQAGRQIFQFLNLCVNRKLSF
jgi:hypothetical protein